MCKVQLSRREHTDAILSAMGGIGRSRFSQFKALLRLSDEAMEIADRHAIDEKKLRFVAGVEPEIQAELVCQIITLKLTSRQVQEICESDRVDSDDEDEHIPAKAWKVVRVLQSIASTSPRDVARALVQQEQGIALARARIQTMRQLLDEAEKMLDNE